MKESSGGPNVLRNRAPKVLTALRAEPDLDVGFDIDGMRKDLAVMLSAAAADRRTLPLVRTALECYDEASAAGWGARDASALAAFRVRSGSKQ
jgi:3-hydroxyisobutyrate dehydrogenase